MKKIVLLFANMLIGSNANAQMEEVATSNTVWNGVTLSQNGRIFVSFPHLEGENGMRVGEILKDNKIIPYPSLDWNDWEVKKDVSHKIVRVNAIRIGPDGNLWIVDTGTVSMGTDPLPGNAAKLIVVDIEKNIVIRTIPLQDVARQHSFFDDLRIYNDHIFITDAGEPAIVILDLKTGKGRRLLEGHPLAICSKPLYAEGKEMHTTDGKLLKIHSDQLEVSPDGKWFFFQPVSGPMARIAVSHLIDEALSPDEVAKHVEQFIKTPTTGGTVIDADGNIYVSDVDHLQILKFTPDGKSSVVIKDPRLIWCDAMWLDDEGYLYLPCGQINRISAFQHGHSKVRFPVVLYRIKTDSKPFKS
jgi:sugar lactone lactonase YvrE